MPMKEFNYCIFQVENSIMKIKEKDQFQCRGDNAIAMMKKVVEMVPEKFEGRTGYISFWDSPPAGRHPGEFELMFASTVRIGEPNQFLPFPCPYSHGWPQVGIPDGRELLRDLMDYKGSWRNKTAFWIGADTHPTRRKLVEISGRNPNAIDASLMEWDRDAEAMRQESKSRYISMWDHRHYKYLIDCPGSGYSARLRWLLASGRPVFIVERQVVEHWHLDLKPWVHFVPIRSDLSDLMLAYKRLEADGDLYQMISRNAREFVRARLVQDRELGRIAQAIPDPSSTGSGLSSHLEQSA
jgi:hypothetical protein